MQFENVGGAGGMVGLPRFVNQRKGQGNSLMVGGSVMIGAGIANKSPVTIKDVTPIARLTEEAGVIVVPSNGKIKTWKELEAALKANPKAAQSLANAYFDALEMIKAEPAKSNEIMGAAVKQTGEAFAKSAAYLRWQDRAANQKFFAGEHAQFSKEAGDLLLELGIIKQLPDMTKLADTRFLK